MPRKIAQNLRIYEKEVSGGKLRAIMEPDEAASFDHATRLPGGFFEAHIRLPTTEGEFWDWRQNRMLSRITVEEASGRMIWEGRIEEVELADFWSVDLRARGYWSNLTDTTLNRSYAGGSNTGGSIIADLLGRVHADTLQLSTSTAHLATGPNIAQEYQDDWTIWRILTDARRGVASFGSGGGGEMDVGVWEGRRLHYAERSPSGVDWLSYVRAENGGGVVEMPSRVAWGDVANAVVATYEAAGVVTRTAAAVDGDSVARHIRRERHVANIGESSAGTANLRRDAELRLRSGLRQRSGDLRIDRVWDADGIEWPTCRVRAGDVIRIPDFIPSADDLAGVNLDDLHTFFIEETLCDHRSGTLTIRPDQA